MIFRKAKSPTTDKKVFFSSIQAFLISALLIILTLTLIVLSSLNYWQLNIQNRRIIETQLINSAQVLDALMIVKQKAGYDAEINALLKQSAEVTVQSLVKQNIIDSASSDYIKYQNRVAFEIWDTQNHKLILKSVNAPKGNIDLHNRPGFQKAWGKHHRHIWYIFSLINPVNHIKIIIALDQEHSNAINWHLFLDDLMFLLFVYAILALIIVFTIRFGIKPLRRLATEVSQRRPSKLYQIDSHGVPTEVRPLIDELNRLFNRVDATLEREKRFNADAAHELRTPLAALRTQAEVALKSQNTDERQNILFKIVAASKRCTRVIEQLLMLAQLEPQQKIDQASTFCLAKCARDTISILATFALKKNIDISLNVEKGNTKLIGNEITIGILLRNLIDNAIQHTPKDGKIDVNISQINKHLKIQVIDTGPGVSEENLQRIFDRFYRQLGTQVDGSGLGLSIVKQIARLHNAKVYAQNRQPHGLEVTVLFNDSI